MAVSFLSFAIYYWASFSLNFILLLNMNNCRSLSFSKLHIKIETQVKFRIFFYSIQIHRTPIEDWSLIQLTVILLNILITINKDSTDRYPPWSNALRNNHIRISYKDKFLWYNNNHPMLNQVLRGSVKSNELIAVTNL